MRIGWLVLSAATALLVNAGIATQLALIPQRDSSGFSDAMRRVQEFR